MQDPSTAITGVVLLVLSGLASYMLAARAGGQNIRWMEREGVAMTVILVLFTLGVLGIGLVVKALV